MSLNMQANDSSQPSQDATTQDANQENNQAPTLSFTARDLLYPFSLLFLLAFSLRLAIGHRHHDFAKSFVFVSWVAFLDIFSSSVLYAKARRSGHPHITDPEKLALRFAPYICWTLAALFDPVLAFSLMAVTIAELAARVVLGPRVETTPHDELRRRFVGFLPYLTIAGMAGVIIAHVVFDVKPVQRKVSGGPVE